MASSGPAGIPLGKTGNATVKKVGHTSSTRFGSDPNATGAGKPSVKDHGIRG